MSPRNRLYFRVGKFKWINLSLYGLSFSLIISLVALFWIFSISLISPSLVYMLRSNVFDLSMLSQIDAILNFRGPRMGSLKSPCRTSYRSSIDTITLSCLVFEKIASLWTYFDDRQTNRWTWLMRKGAVAVASGALTVWHYQCRQSVDVDNS